MGGMETRGMGKKGVVEDKGKRGDNELIGMLKVGAISTS
jgi:hypothetical protein